MSAVNATQTTAPNSVAHNAAQAGLTSAEWKLAFIILGTFCAGVAIAAYRHQAVDWPDFWPVMVLCLELVLVGVVIRRTRFLARTATGMIAFGLILCFMTCCSIMTFSILPFSNPMIDQQLLDIDATLGFDWVDAVNSLANYPTFAGVLRFVYFSLFPQMAFVMICLSVLRRDIVLHRFLMVGFLGMLTTNFVWWLFPSVGPAAYGMVSEDVQQKVQLIANAEFGEKMRLYSTQGLSLITGSKMSGVVAFPSMHIVLTAMVMWFSRRTWMFFPLLALNLVMPIATVLQGGHHIVDLFGGLLIFCGCVKLASKLIPDANPASEVMARNSQPQQ